MDPDGTIRQYNRHTDTLVATIPPGAAVEPSRTVECVQCHEQVEPVGCYTDPLGRRPGGEAICGACIDHLDGKEWTKAALLAHLNGHNHIPRQGLYISAMRKTDMVSEHSYLHSLESRVAADPGELI